MYWNGWLTPPWVWVGLPNASDWSVSMTLPLAAGVANDREAAGHLQLFLKTLAQQGVVVGDHDGDRIRQSHGAS